MASPAYKNNSLRSKDKNLFKIKTISNSIANKNDL